MNCIRPAIALKVLAKFNRVDSMIDESHGGFREVRQFLFCEGIFSALHDKKIPNLHGEGRLGIFSFPMYRHFLMDVS